MKEQKEGWKEEMKEKERKERVGRSNKLMNRRERWKKEWTNERKDMKEWKKKEGRKERR